MWGSRMESVQDGVVLEVEPRVTAVFSGFSSDNLQLFISRVLVWERDGYDSPLQITGVTLWAYHTDVYAAHVLFSNRGTFAQFMESFATWGIPQDLS